MNDGIVLFIISSKKLMQDSSNLFKEIFKYLKVSFLFKKYFFVSPSSSTIKLSKIGTGSSFFPLDFLFFSIIVSLSLTFLL